MEGTELIEQLLDTITLADRTVATVTAVKLHALNRARLENEAIAAAAGRDKGLAYRSFRAEVAAAMSTTEGVADRWLSEAFGLSRLPLTSAALAAGTISHRHAQVMIEETTSMTDAERAELERRAMPTAVSMTPTRLTRVLRSLRERRIPECAAERHRVAMLRRGVYATPTEDGMANIHLHTSGVDAVASMDRLEAAAKALRGAGDPRTMGQIKHDIVADLLLGRDSADTAMYSKIVPTVLVTFPIDTLVGDGTELPELEGYGPIDTDTALQLAERAPCFRRLLIEKHTGAKLSLGRERYKVTDDQRIWLRLRRDTCSFPGCDRPSRFADIDHTRDWTRLNGFTDDDNLSSMCRGHHTVKHTSGWTPTQDPDRPGTLEWLSPLHRKYLTRPDADEIPHPTEPEPELPVAETDPPF